jgi:hypothetical protein
VGKTKRGNGTKVMAMADRSGLPVAVPVAAASPPAGTLVAPTLAAYVVAGRPARRSGDQASARDPLAATLAAPGSAMSAPPRVPRQAPNPQAGRPLRRDKRRWKVARRVAWLHNVRRVLGRHEDPVENDLGVVSRGGIIILLRWYL